MAERLFERVEQEPIYKEKMDRDTYELFLKASKEYDITTGIPFPFLLIKCVCEDRGYFGKRNRDLKREYFAYKAKGSVAYAELYKVLAFTIFGYGCWSNNDRSRKGLSSVRFTHLRETTKQTQQVS